ncbi:MAG: hypothetical protein JST32_08965 [Bacteroidetes bacterium]|nr:hypothetical protein [Bacteroidota bacterium]
MEPENNISTTTDNGKNVAIVSYLSIIGWLIAYFAMHNDKKTELGSYHLRQTLLFYIFSFGVYIVWSVIVTALIFSLSLGLASIALLLNWVIYIGLFVLWIIGFIGAINGEKKPIPLIGDKAQTMFKGI